jgi:hypothetical protein
LTPPTTTSPIAYGSRLRTPTWEASPPRPEDDLPDHQLYAFALLALRNLTMGIEQEVYVIDEFGQLVNLSRDYPELSVPAKALPPGIVGPRQDMLLRNGGGDSPYYLDHREPPGFIDGKPVIGDEYFGALNEAVDFAREFITAPFRVRTAADIRRQHVRLDNAINRRLAAFGLTQLYGGAPIHVPPDGIKRTDYERYDVVRAADPEGFDEGRTTAGLQINLGTIPKQIRSRLVGLAGDSSHLLLAVSGATPFRWTSYAEGAKYRWDASNPQPDDSFLIDNGFASNRGPSWWRMQTTVATPPAYLPGDSAKARDAHLEAIGRPGAKSLFHVQDREQAFGLERRSPDTPPTIEERELVSLLSVADLVLGLQRLVSDPRRPQMSGQQRSDAARDAAENGMTGNLIDPDTGLPRNAYEILEDRLDLVRAGLEAFERGDLAAVLDSDARPVDGVSTSTIYNRAKEVLGTLKEIGTPAERMRSALDEYRRRDGGNPPNAFLPDGRRIITEDEARFLHGYTLAEQRTGLTTNREFVYAQALDLAEQAASGELRLEGASFSPEIDFLLD